MKRFLLLMLTVGWLIILPYYLSAQERYATCDLCGYCPPNQPPSTWQNCQKCLYPMVSSDPELRETLKIDPSINLPPTPFPGRWYTMLGCINTNLGSFQEEGAGASVVQILLNFIFGTAGMIALVYFIYGSFLVITSQSDPERLGRGKRIITGAIIGLIFTLSSVFLVNLIAGGVLKIPTFGSSP